MREIGTEGTEGEGLHSMLSRTRPALDTKDSPQCFSALWRPCVLSGWPCTHTPASCSPCTPLPPTCTFPRSSSLPSPAAQARRPPPPVTASCCWRTVCGVGPVCAALSWRVFWVVVFLRGGQMCLQPVSGARADAPEWRWDGSSWTCLLFQGRRGKGELILEHP